MSEWSVRAYAALEKLAGIPQEFSSDDLIDLVGQPDAAHAPNARNNAIGSLFRQAAAAGLIVSDGRLVKSRQPHRKGGAVRLWVGRQWNL